MQTLFPNEKLRVAVQVALLAVSLPLSNAIRLSALADRLKDFSDFRNEMRLRVVNQVNRIFLNLLSRRLQFD
jgi:hypothetical protein